jgi:hypothetical protein
MEQKTVNLELVPAEHRLILSIASHRALQAFPG